MEARDRVGGRTYSPLCGDRALDLGGGWIGPTQSVCDLLFAFVPALDGYLFSKEDSPAGGKVRVENL